MFNAAVHGIEFDYAQELMLNLNSDSWNNADIAAADSLRRYEEASKATVLAMLSLLRTPNVKGDNPLHTANVKGYNPKWLEVNGAQGVKGANKTVANAAKIHRPSNFANRKLLESHFEKHVVKRDEFKGAYKTADEYLEGALDVVNNGTPVKYAYKGEERTGFVRFAGTSKPKGNKAGNAKFEFVGTNNEGHITTYHIESKDFWKMLNGDKNHKVIYPAE